MRISVLVCLLAACVAVALARTTSTDFTDAERWEATLQGITEAREHISNEQEKAKQQAAKKKKSPQTAAMLLKKFFHKASVRSTEMGKARVFIEEAVKKSERILLDKKRAKTARTADKEALAEALAEELYHKPGTILGKKELAHIYQESRCEELAPEVDCSLVPFYHSVRTISGICNNLEESTQGAAFTPFRRLTPAFYANGVDRPFNQANVGTGDDDIAFQPPAPSARLISQTSVLDRELNSTTLTHLIMQWGQFMDHDLDLNVEFGENEFECNLETCEETIACFPVRVPEDDEMFGVGTSRDGDCLPFVRTVPACIENPFIFEPRNPVNELTHYIDGSMVYGSTDARAEFLREMEGGRLKVSEGNNLPIVMNAMNGEESTCPPVEGPLGEVEEHPEECCPEAFVDGCFAAGDVRAIEHVSLTVIHTIWVREHNRVAAALAVVNPQWTDERLYIEARNIVIAQIQQLTFVEYLPALFGIPLFNQLIGPYTGYNDEVDASVPNSFATAAYRFGHSQIQPVFERLDSNGQSIAAGPLGLRESFFSTTEYFNSADNGIGTEVDTITRGWVEQPARALDEFLNSVLTSQLFEPDDEPGEGMDLATLNVQRGRDHGLQRYGIWRQFCLDAFGISSGFRNELTEIRLLQLYGSIDDADLFVAALAEEPLEGSVLGATLACIFAITFRDLRDGDRFWYENPDPELGLFTPEQLAEIRGTNFGAVLCDNTNVGSVPFPSPFQQESKLPCNSPLSSSGIDFSAWAETPVCYYRVEVTTAAATEVNLFFTEVVGDSTLFSQGVFGGEAATTEGVCVPIVCPLPGIPASVVTFGDVSSPCVANGGPGSTFINLNIASVDSTSGIFGSATECEASSVSIVEYQCSNEKKKAVAKTANTDLERELASILSHKKGGKKVAKVSSEETTVLLKQEPLDIDNTPINIPDDARKALEDAQNGGGKKQTSKQTSKQSTKETEHTDKKLVNLLEAMLQELKDE